MSRAEKFSTIAAIVWVYLLFVAGIAAIVSLLKLRTLSYTALVESIIANTHRPDLYTVITTRFFTPHKFSSLQQFILPSITVLVIILLGIIWKRKTITIKVRHLIHACILVLLRFLNTFVLLKKMHQIVIGCILILVITRGIYLAATFYIQYDEAFNYNYFLHKNILYSVVAYNNYPLHNIISWCVVHFFSHDLLMQRLPSIISGIGLALVCFYSVQRWFNNTTIAIAIMATLVCMPVFIFYSLYARGVMFNLFFSAILFYYIINAADNLTYRRVFLLAVLNMLALYSMLSHLYFIIASFIFFINIILIHKKPQQIKPALLYCILSIALSYCVLIPMQLGTGLELGLNAAQSKNSLQFSAIVNYVKDLSYFFVGGKYIFFIILFLNVSFLFLPYILLKKIGLLNIWLLLLAFIIPLFTHVFPPERSLSFIVLAYLFTLPGLFHYYTLIKKPVIIISSTILLCIVLHYKALTHEYLNWSKPLDKSANTVAQLFLNQKINACYSTSHEFDYYAPALQYYFLRHNRNFEFHTNAKGSTRYIAETNNTLPCIIVDSNNYKIKKALNGYIRIYAFNEFEIFLKK